MVKTVFYMFALVEIPGNHKYQLFLTRRRVCAKKKNIMRSFPLQSISDCPQNDRNDFLLRSSSLPSPVRGVDITEEFSIKRAQHGELMKVCIDKD